MYSPVKDGIHKSAQLVKYIEAKPKKELIGLVDCFWELKTESDLQEDFVLHVIPDACVNILFNLLDTNIAAITARKTSYVELNLGKKFHYVGIQLLPGVWQGKREEIHFGFVDKPYNGDLPLVETASKLVNLNFSEMQSILSKLVHDLIEEKFIVLNEVVSRILSDLDTIETVSEMAASANLSPRQLQRNLKKTTGFSPHDLLKVLRLQLSFKGHYTEYYVDQSHFIHSFKKITGYTPKEFFKSFDV